MISCSTTGHRDNIAVYCGNAPGTPAKAGDRLPNAWACSTHGDVWGWIHLGRSRGTGRSGECGTGSVRTACDAAIPVSPGAGRGGRSLDPVPSCYLAPVSSTRHRRCTACAAPLPPGTVFYVAHTVVRGDQDLVPDLPAESVQALVARMEREGDWDRYEAEVHTARKATLCPACREQFLRALAPFTVDARAADQEKQDHGM